MLSPLKRAIASNLFVVTVAVLSVAGCGSNTDQQIDTATKAAPSSTQFPSVKGQTWADVAQTAPKDPQTVVSPAGQTYEQGRNRFSFGLFKVDRSQIPDAKVAIYAAHGHTGTLQGPYPARIESLQTEPAFKSQTVSQDPEAATVAYVSNLKFAKPGEWRLIAMVDDGNGFVPNLLPSIEVGAYPKIPDVGDMAPRIHTPTVADVGDVSKIDTRSPHDTMHDIDFFDAVGKKPTVLLFATPALCTSRVCGPMVDIEEQVKSETNSDVAFIHQEVYNGNDPNKGIRPQLRAYGLQTEPWLFVIDKTGRISTRIEGPFSVADLTDAVAKVEGFHRVAPD